MAKLDSRLLNDSEVLGKFKLCHVLLMRDANYPWCILVPDREGITEVFELIAEEQVQLNKESAVLLKYLKEHFKADKMNVAALGNVVSQLHVHHIVRYKDDISWPSPVWGAHPAKQYTESDLKQRVAELRIGLSRLDLGFESE